MTILAELATCAVSVTTGSSSSSVGWIVRGLKAGDRVRFGFDQPPAGPTVRRMAKVAGQ